MENSKHFRFSPCHFVLVTAWLLTYLLPIMNCFDTSNILLCVYKKFELAVAVCVCVCYVWGILISHNSSYVTRITESMCSTYPLNRMRMRMLLLTQLLIQSGCSGCFWRYTIIIYDSNQLLGSHWLHYWLNWMWLVCLNTALYFSLKSHYSSWSSLNYLHIVWHCWYNIVEGKIEMSERWFSKLTVLLFDANHSWHFYLFFPSFVCLRILWNVVSLTRDHHKN